MAWDDFKRRLGTGEKERSVTERGIAVTEASTRARGEEDRLTDKANFSLARNNMTAAQRARAANDWERNNNMGFAANGSRGSRGTVGSRKAYDAQSKTIFDQNMKAREFNMKLDEQISTTDGFGATIHHPGKALSAQFGKLKGDDQSKWLKTLSDKQKEDMRSFGEIEKQRMPLQTQAQYQEPPQQGVIPRQPNPYFAGSNRDINTTGWSDKRIARSQGEARHRVAKAMGPRPLSGTNTIEGIGQQMEGWDPNGPTAVSGASDHGIFQRDDGTYTNYGKPASDSPPAQPTAGSMPDGIIPTDATPLRKKPKKPSTPFNIGTLSFGLPSNTPRSRVRDVLMERIGNQDRP